MINKASITAGQLPVLGIVILLLLLPITTTATLAILVLLPFATLFVYAAGIVFGRAGLAGAVLIAALTIVGTAIRLLSLP